MGQEIHRFLHALRSLVRGRNAVAIITLPPSLVRNQDEDSIKRLSWAVDASLEIKGFAGMSSLFLSFIF
jgi:elongator complex protein 4